MSIRISGYYFVTGQKNSDNFVPNFSYGPRIKSRKTSSLVAHRAILYRTAKWFSLKIFNIFIILFKLDELNNLFFVKKLET